MSTCLHPLNIHGLKARMLDFKFVIESYHPSRTEASDDFVRRWRSCTQNIEWLRLSPTLSGMRGCSLVISAHHSGSVVLTCPCFHWKDEAYANLWRSGRVCSPNTSGYTLLSTCTVCRDSPSRPLQQWNPISPKELMLWHRWLPSPFCLYDKCNYTQLVKVHSPSS